eukprot:ANDGO_00280.mRNA.1 DNA primase small subunit
MSKRTIEEVNPYLKIYYDRFFPFESMYKWLSLFQSRPFPNREFSFTFGEDIYVRYQSFQNCEDWAAAVRDRCPSKIDIGAEFSFAPKDHNSVGRGEFVPREKELVFDIDMTDYDDVRTCCKEAQVCSKCWGFMVVACRVVDQILDQSFGFDSRLWIFSGRRGIHCWVCDPAARSLSIDGRSAVADFLNVRDKAQFRPQFLHPAHRSVYEEIMLPFFPTLVESQGWFDDASRWRKALEKIEDKELAATLHSKFETQSSGTQRWKTFANSVKPSVAADFVFTYTFPRLDVHVSKGFNHLLKSPFSVHPKTGKVCVPLDPSTVDQFEPAVVPTIEQLAMELDAFQAKRRGNNVNGGAAADVADDDNGDDDGDGSQRCRDAEKTSMRSAVQFFDKFVSEVGKRVMEEKKKTDLSF